LKSERINLVRALVEFKAQQAGRHDILAALPGISDPEILDRWLAEL
jgi:hypothetical protein